MDYETLKLIWWLLIGVLLIGFAIMDGHDMGMGVLLPMSWPSMMAKPINSTPISSHQMSFRVS